MLQLAEVAAVLEGTELAGLAVQDGPAAALVVSGFRAEDSEALLRVWRVAYALLPVTGRWPLLIATDLGREYLMKPSPSEEAVLADLDRAAHRVDPWPHFQQSEDDAPDVELSFFTEGLYGVDVTDDVLPEVGPDVGIQQLLRAAYDHVLADPGLTAQVLADARDDVSTKRWFVPAGVSLLLLPTASPWLASHWMDFWGAIEHEQELAAVLWQWHDRWDVRPVASWGTMLQFEVYRPPASGDDAFMAARQLLALSPNVDLQQWELAVAITVGDAWFVHHRP